MTELKHIQQLDFNLLKVFECLYVERNMTRVAERLFITPSAVSHAVKRLRECLGDPLFERAGNEMRPTPVCQRMAPLIIDNLSRLRQILQQWGEFDPNISEHHFRIAMHDALEPSIVPRLSKLLALHAPGVTFASIKVERNHLSRELAAGHIDVAFDVAMPIKSPIMHQYVVQDRFVLMCDRQHTLSQHASFEDYFAAKHISVSHRPNGAAVEDLIFQEQGQQRKLAVRCQNYYTAKEVIKDSELLLTVTSSIANRLLDNQLVMFDLPFDMPPVKTHLYWHQQTQQDEALIWLRDIMIQAMQEF